MLRAKEFIMKLALELGIIINLEKSSLVPTQVLDYLGMTIDTDRPTGKRADSALQI